MAELLSKIQFEQLIHELQDNAPKCMERVQQLFDAAVAIKSERDDWEKTATTLREDHHTEVGEHTRTQATLKLELQKSEHERLRISEAHEQVKMWFLDVVTSIGGPIKPLEAMGFIKAWVMERVRADGIEGQMRALIKELEILRGKK